MAVDCRARSSWGYLRGCGVFREEETVPGTAYGDTGLSRSPGGASCYLGNKNSRMIRQSNFKLSRVPSIAGQMCTVLPRNPSQEKDIFSHPLRPWWLLVLPCGSVTPCTAPPETSSLSEQEEGGTFLNTLLRRNSSSLKTVNMIHTAEAGTLKCDSSLRSQALLCVWVIPK